MTPPAASYEPSSTPEPPDVGTPAHNRLVAERELRAGNLAHGARHLALLVEARPGDDDTLSLIDRYMKATGGKLDDLISPPEGDNFAPGQAALSAWCMAARGEVENAASLMVSLCRAVTTDRALAEWGPLWFTDSRSVEGVSPATAQMLVSEVIFALPERSEQNNSERALMDRWLHISELLRPALLDTPSGLMTMASALRRAGKFDLALEILDAAIVDDPTWHAYIARGLVLKYSDRLEKAAAAFDDACKLDPTNIAGWLESGDAWMDLGDFCAALGRYEMVLSNNPEHPWANPSAAWCRWRLTQQSEHIERLEMLDAARNWRASSLLKNCGWNEVEYLFPEPREASLKLVLSMRHGQTLTAIGTSSMESPSSHRLIRLLLANANFAINSPPPSLGHSDPRLSLAPIRWPLWIYNELTATPGLPPPSGRFERGVQRVAQIPWKDWDQQWEEAGDVAKGILTEAELIDLLAHSVHFSLPTTEVRPEVHVRRVQHAVAWIAAQVRPEQPWQGSLRCAAIRCLLLGPQDWTTTAGITASFQIARRNETARVDIHTMVKSLWNHEPLGYWEWQHALAALWPKLPDCEQEMVKTLNRFLEEADMQ